VTIHCVFPNIDRSIAVCLWEAESLQAVKDFLETHLGQISINDYFEVAVEDALGLPASDNRKQEVIA
jgi:hypothetical protein